MMQGYEWTQAATVNELQQHSIVLESFFVPFTLGRLKSSPIERDANGIESQISAKIKVMRSIVPPVAGRRTRVARADSAPPFPFMPLVMKVAAFELVGGRGDAPKESRGKLEHSWLCETVQSISILVQLYRLRV